MDAPSDIFNVTECVIPDLDQWHFRFENSNQNQISSWLQTEAHRDVSQHLTSSINQHGKPFVQYQQPTVSTADFQVFNEFFPSISPYSSFSSSSTYSGSFGGTPPPSFYPQSTPPQWSNVRPVYYQPYEQYAVSYPSQSSPPSQNIRPKAEKGVKECSNCRTKNTIMWRWNTATGERECNACRLYEMTNNCKRPPALWKDKILKRRRRNPKQFVNN